MRHVAAAVLRQLNFPGKDVAAVLGLSPVTWRRCTAGTAGGDGGAGPAGGTAPGDRRGGVGPGAAVAGRRGAGRGDRAAAGGEPVHRAAAAGPGARAGPAAGTAGAGAGGHGTGGCGRGGRGRSGGRGGHGAGTGGPARARGPGAAGPGAAAGGGQRPAEPVTVRSGMPGRCCCTRSRRGPGPGTSSGPRPGRTRRRRTRRCWQRSARASPSARRPPSSSSTWPRRRPDRWPGCPGCRGCGRCDPGWPRSRTGPTRWTCSGCSPPRCWTLTRSPQGCTTSMTTSCHTPAPSRFPRGGTTSGAGPREAAPTRTSPRTTGGRCALPPASRPGCPSRCPRPSRS